MHVLIVEDDTRLARVLRTGLLEEGFAVTHEVSASAAQRRGATGSFDAIVLDVMLPGGTGFDVCREWRRIGMTVPVLMLTARDAVEDRVRGLDAGADDYLTKPFAFAELVARLRALNRRRTTRPATTQVGDFVIDLRSRRASRAGRDIELTAKEFALLEIMVLNLNQVVDRTAITAHVWDDNHDPSTNVLEVLMWRLRRKLDDPHAVKLIHTVRGSGYRFGS